MNIYKSYINFHFHKNTGFLSIFQKQVVFTNEICFSKNSFSNMFISSFINFPQSFTIFGYELIILTNFQKLPKTCFLPMSDFGRPIPSTDGCLVSEKLSNVFPVDRNLRRSTEISIRSTEFHVGRPPASKYIFSGFLN